MKMMIGKKIHMKEFLAILVVVLIVVVLIVGGLLVINEATKDPRLGVWINTIFESTFPDCLQLSYLTFNDAITEGDCHAITEAGWFADRWITLKMFREEHYECKYIIVDTPEGRREGIGLICRQTLIQWCQPGSIIFCILAEYDYKNKKWLEAQNPF